MPSNGRYWTRPLIAKDYIVPTGDGSTDNCHGQLIKLTDCLNKSSKDYSKCDGIKKELNLCMERYYSDMAKKGKTKHEFVKLPFQHVKMNEGERYNAAMARLKWLRRIR